MSALVIQTIHQALIREYQLPVELRTLIVDFTCVALTTENIKEAIDQTVDCTTQRKAFLTYGPFYFEPILPKFPNKYYWTLDEYLLFNKPRYLYKPSEVAGTCWFQ